MLNHIHIKNFTIVDDLALDLKPGMTVLTGETGAGKSIIIDAIEIALGQRASSDLIRHGASRAEITISFDVSTIPAAANWLQENELNNDDECILRRTINKDGRSKSYINGTPINLQTARQLGELLINIHGQHEFQTLLKPDLQRKLLDGFAKHSTLIDAVKSTYENWRAIKDNYEQLKKNSQDSTARTEFLNYQLKELNEFNTTKEEIISLGLEQKTLANAETLLQNSQTALDNLQSEQLSLALQHINSIKHIHPNLTNAAELVNNALINTEEAHHEIQHYLEQVELNPERLSYVDSRLSKAHDLSRKHHIKMEELQELQVRMQTELNLLENSDNNLSALEEQIETLQKAYHLAAKKLTQSRSKAAKKLSALIVDNMQQLGMPGGKLSIELKPLADDTPHAHGSEKIQFLVSANPGQPLQPLNKVASGGELSRISLAIQVITAQFSNTPSLIFDEVDVGIGGATADIVGKLLRKLSDATQVICITHLAQVASKGHQHLQVSKSSTRDKTQTQITELAPDVRIEEIARMAGGVSITTETLAHAKMMLETV